MCKKSVNLFIFYIVLQLSFANGRRALHHKYVSPYREKGNGQYGEVAAFEAKQIPEDQTDYGGDAEPNDDSYPDSRVDENVEKREAVQQFDLDDLTDDEIAQALSNLSGQELATLDQMMAEENAEELADDNRYMDKREASEGRPDDEEDYDEYEIADENHNCANKFCNGRKCNVHKKSAFRYRNKRSDEKTTEPPLTTAAPIETTTVLAPSENKTVPSNSTTVLLNHVDPTFVYKLKGKRHAKYHPNREFTSTDKQIQAKINYLREKNKRDSMLKSIERERQGRSKSKRQSRNYYFNSMLGPQIRRKRDNSEVTIVPKADKTTPETDNQNLAESDHLRLLEESFPNPSAESDSAFHQYDAPLVRVKRDI